MTLYEFVKDGKSLKKQITPKRSKAETRYEMGRQEEVMPSTFVLEKLFF